MDQLEEITQKKLEDFCKYCPVHVQKWKGLLEQSSKTTQSLERFLEQQSHLERSDLKVIDGFTELQSRLVSTLTKEIEWELHNLQLINTQLQATNQSLKSKLQVLEGSSTKLDWERKSLVVTGNAVQPPLDKLLQLGLDFTNFFGPVEEPFRDSLEGELRVQGNGMCEAKLRHKARDKNMFPVRERMKSASGGRRGAGVSIDSREKREFVCVWPTVGTYLPSSQLARSTCHRPSKPPLFRVNPIKKIL